MMSSRLRIIVTGLVAQHPTVAGVAWDYAQFAFGLMRLGHDTYYIEDSGEWPYLIADFGEWPYLIEVEPDSDEWVAPDCRANVVHLATVMARFGLTERWAYRFPRTGEWFGLSDSKRASVIASADLVINISGTLARPSKYHSARRMAYIDSDPVFTQLKLALGHRRFLVRALAHDIHFSFGDISSAAVPKAMFRWYPTRQPIVLSEWRPAPPRRPTFTTIISWASYQPLTYDGQTFGQKDVQFRRYLELPKRLPPGTVEVAVGEMQHTDWESGNASDGRYGKRSVRQVLADAGWAVVSAREACRDLDAYRAYIEDSMGEWSVAKHGYVAGRSGWFSCRSACYLAAGKPVVVENTGFDRSLPVGRGILTFSTVEEAAAAINEVRANYALHATAAREIAEAYFDSDKVLTAIVETAMASSASNFLQESA